LGGLPDPRFRGWFQMVCEFYSKGGNEFKVEVEVEAEVPMVEIKIKVESLLNLALTFILRLRVKFWLNDS